MLKQERQELILSEITAQNKVHSADLSLKLNVSEDTIRRDLKELADQGYVKKVHGGAMANPVGPQSIQQESISHESERQVLINKCLPLIRPHGILIIEGTETAALLAEQLPSDLSLTVFTNSLPVANRLLHVHHVDTHFIGGKISVKHQGTMGTEVIQNLADIQADQCFMEFSGIHPEIGITAADREYAITLKAILKSSTELIGLSLSKDIGTMQPFRVATTDKLSKLVTELEQPNKQVATFLDKGVDVL
ncbi:MAG: DeoR/GlpR family DNA-binding transcription regulator [Cytophagales bacterium]|nr:DeoR/GlpR family DNA-binding transcription regulator [Cytophagales bacterium]